jgi:hypothetical protein
MTRTSHTVVEELFAVVAATETFVDPEQIEEWAAVLRQRPPTEVFDALFGVFDTRDGMAQEVAGRLLLELRPPCTPGIPEAIRRILPTWNISVEELFEYFEALVGRETLLRALDDVSLQTLSEREQVALDTIRYWLAAFSQGYSSRDFQ